MIKKSMDESKKGFIKSLGGISFKKIDDKNFEFPSSIKETHLNTGGIAHGGYLASIADAGMGTAAHMISENKRCVTINLELKFISAGKLSDNLIGKVKILKKTKSLIFISCEIHGSSDIVVSATGTWKILN